MTKVLTSITAARAAVTPVSTATTKALAPTSKRFFL